MATTEQTIPEEKSRRTLIIVVAIIAAIAIGGLFYFLLRKAAAPTPPPTLQGAIRPGSPDWDKHQARIVLDDPADCPEAGSRFCATESKRALGDIVMTLHATVRNLTGRTITGLEIRGTIVDADGKPIRERTLVVIPARQPELESLKTMRVSMEIVGLTDKDYRANVKMEVTGFTLR